MSLLKNRWPLSDVPLSGLSVGTPFSLQFTVHGNSLALLVNGSAAGSATGTLTGAGVDGLWATPGDTFGAFTVSALP
jgi:hypothetical protein